MNIPFMSLFLSHIEILTHAFRPITPTLRLWVNIWIGHLILRRISFLSVVLGRGGGIFSLLKGFFVEGSFFLFESLIIGLQTYVFTYLVKYYFEENQHHAEIHI